MNEAIEIFERGMTEKHRKAEAAALIRDHGTNVDFMTVAEALSWWDVVREEWRGPSEEDLEAVWGLLGKAKVTVTWE